MDKAFRVAVILTAQDEMTRKITSTMDKVDRRMQRTAYAAQQAGRQMMGAGLAMGAGIALPVKTAMDFERQMSKVGAISRATNDELLALSDEARRLGALTDRSATEAAQAMEFLSMAGLSVAEQLKATEGIIQLAGAGAMDLGSSADIATNILGAFRLEVSEMTRVNDALVNTFTRSNVNLLEISDAMKMAAPIAAGLGGEIEEVAAMIGLLGDVGIKGTMAGTALRAAYQRLAAPTGAAAAAIEKMNIDIEDSDGNMRSLTSIMADMAKQTEEMGNVARTAALKDIFGERAAGPMAELLSQAGSDQIKKFTEDVSQGGAAAEAYARMLDNTHGALKAAQSAAEAVAITMGNQLLPEMNSALGVGTEMLRWANAFAVENQAISGGLMKVVTALSAFLLIGGGTVWAFGKFLDLARLAIKPIGLVAKGVVFMASAFAKGAVVMLRTGSVVKGLTALMRALNLAVLANPWVLAAAAAVTAGVLIYKYWEPIKAFFVGLWTDIKTAFDKGWVQGILKVIETFHPLVWIAKGWNAVVDWLFDFSLFDAGANLINSLWDGMKSLASKPVEIIQDITGKVRDFLPFSPAKVGPLKDIHRVNIIDTIAKTMKPAPMVRAMENVTGAAMSAGTSFAGPARQMQFSGAGVGGSGTVINYSPEITIGGQVNEADRQSFADQLRRHKDELKRMMDRIMDNQNRKSFN